MNWVLGAKEFINKITKAKSPRILDCSFTYPIIQKDKYIVFNQRRIPQATFFDSDKIKDIYSPYPHMLPN